MEEARFIEFGPISDDVGGPDLVVISPNDPETMIRHTDECRSLGVPFMADRGQQLARIAGPQIRRKIDGAHDLVTNDHERALPENKTGWTSDQVFARVEVRVTTLGAKGCVIERADGVTQELAAGLEEIRGSDRRWRRLPRRVPRGDRLAARSGTVRADRVGQWIV